MKRRGVLAETRSEGMGAGGRHAIIHGQRCRTLCVGGSALYSRHIYLYSRHVDSPKLVYWLKTRPPQHGQVSTPPRSSVPKPSGFRLHRLGARFENCPTVRYLKLRSTPKVKNWHPTRVSRVRVQSLSQGGVGQRWTSGGRTVCAGSTVTEAFT